MPSIKNLSELLASRNENDTVVKIDSLLSEFCDHGDEIEKLTHPQKIFFFNQSFEKEINNGGFSQYFLNSSGDFATETIESLKLIGAHQTAAILQRAVDEFPNGHVPKNRRERIALLEDIEEAASKVWQMLEQKFYKYEENLNALNLRYVRQNKTKF
jgi:hypothetical protein